MGYVWLEVFADPERRLKKHTTDLKFRVALFSVAFQCAFPHPWSTISNTCFDRVRSENQPCILLELTDL